MKLQVKLSQKRMSGTLENHRKALVETCAFLRKDIIESQRIPMDTGTLQNSLAVQGDKNSLSVTLACTVPYAARLYFHPEFHFSKKRNRFAGAGWFETYLTGTKRNFFNVEFAKRLGKLNSGLNGGSKQ